MKENVLDVLIYLFDNYMDEDMEWEPDRDDLVLELEQAGFRDGEISGALDWLDGLAAHRAGLSESDSKPEQAVRVFSGPELERLDVESRGFILYLCQHGILDPTHREIVIERAMALDDEEVALEQVKWVILMVLFNLPGQEATYAWMEDLVFENQIGLFH